jgi:Flp pilus assembly protein TadG
MNRRGIWPGLKHKTEGCPNLGRNLLQTFLHDASAFSVGLRSSKLGQVLVLVALALVALIAFVALAVDVGFIWGARRKMQTAADAAATAGAIASRQGQSSANITAAATDVAGLNGFSSGLSVNPSYSGGGSLSALTSDTYVGTADVKGVLFWDTSTSVRKVAGGSGSTFDGALYFPQSQLTYTGNSSSGCGTSACSTGSNSGCGYTIIAADSVQFGGTTNFCDDYSSLSGGASPIESTTLYQ